MVGNKFYVIAINLLVLGTLLSSIAGASIGAQCLASLQEKNGRRNRLSSLIEQSKQSVDLLINEANESRIEDRSAKRALAFKEWKRYQRMTIVSKITHDHEEFLEACKEAEVSSADWFSVLGPYTAMEFVKDSMASLDSYSYSDDGINKKYLPTSFRSAVTPDSIQDKSAANYKRSLFTRNSSNRI